VALRDQERNQPLADRSGGTRDEHPHPGCLPNRITFAATTRRTVPAKRTGDEARSPGRRFADGTARRRWSFPVPGTAPLAA
jgi:hypothetical protein